MVLILKQMSLKIVTLFFLVIFCYFRDEGFLLKGALQMPYLFYMYFDTKDCSLIEDTKQKYAFIKKSTILIQSL